MNKELILTELYQSEVIRGIAKSMVRDNSLMTWQDLLHTAIIKVAELPDEKLALLYDKRQTTFYMYGIMRNQNISPHLEFNKNNSFTGSELIEEITPEFTEPTETPTDQYTYDQFAKFCYTKAESPVEPPNIKLSAQVTYGYLTFIPTHGRKSYRTFQNATGINYSSISVYVKQMRELYLHENKPAI